ncbi:GNAT family N-acetyltransferase [Gordonia soli]|uniref:Putative acetyltransferase n=1 Tax=Gordonia soli NBRC 108243 TaxID=1223545 RepID=M0QK08_9ACTN|nr:GNAT family N-acetyltransferase [Gordonia soli]GAC68626.1 putative acetyltransferase [Gordonia soli NBRC 108243]
MTTLATDRLLLRAPDRQRDADDVFHACQDPLIQRYTLVPVPYTRADAATFFDRAVRPTSNVFVIRRAVDDAFVGVCGVREVAPGEGSIGFWCAPTMRGHGYLREAVRAILDVVTSGADGPGFRTVRWRAMTDNIGSARVAAAVGFAYTGPEWEDVHGVPTQMSTARWSVDEDPPEARGWPPTVVGVTG